MPPLKDLSQRLWVRATLLYTFIFTASSLLILAITLAIGSRQLTAQVRAQVAAEVRFLLAEYQEDGLTELLEETEERIEKNPRAVRFLYLVQNAQGQMLFDAVAPLPGELGWQERSLDEGSQQTDYLFYYQRLDEGHLLGVGASLGGVSAFQQAIGTAFLAALLCALGIGLASGLAAGAWLSRRLELLLQALEQVAAGHWHTRLEPTRPGHTGIEPSQNTGNREWNQLVSGLNRLFGHLEQAINNLKYLSAGLAHDLRTPISRLANRISALPCTPAGTHLSPEQMALLQEELDGLLGYFDAALLIHELHSGQLSKHFQPLLLCSLVQEILDDYSPLLEDAQIHLSQAIHTPIAVQGMASLLRRLIANLLDNVLLHGGRGCTLEISLKPHKTATALLCFNNSGGSNSQTSNHPDSPQTANDSALTDTPRKKMGQKIIQAIVTSHGGQCSISGDQSFYSCEIELPLITTAPGEL